VEASKSIAKIQLYDKKGTMDREVTISGRMEPNKWGYNTNGMWGRRICFSPPFCDYYINSLMQFYPFEKDLTIDMMGRNHRGSEVTVKAEDLNRIFDQLPETEKWKSDPIVEIEVCRLRVADPSFENIVLIKERPMRRMALLMNRAYKGCFKYDRNRKALVFTGPTSIANELFEEK